MEDEAAFIGLGTVGFRLTHTRADVRWCALVYTYRHARARIRTRYSQASHARTPSQHKAFTPTNPHTLPKISFITEFNQFSFSLVAGRKTLSEYPPFRKGQRAGDNTDLPVVRYQ